MSTFAYDSTHLSKEELLTISSYLIRYSNSGLLARQLSKATSDVEIVRKYLKRAVVILNCLKTIPEWDDRGVFLYSQCDGDDVDFICKVCVGHLDLEASMESAEALIEAGVSEGAYLNTMNTLKHMYNVKKRYWQ